MPRLVKPLRGGAAFLLQVKAVLADGIVEGIQALLVFDIRLKCEFQERLSPSSEPK